MTAITAEIVAEHGLSPEEFERVKEHMGRKPNLVELGVFSVMWSEHCSYKSVAPASEEAADQKHPWVICGPGENAGESLISAIIRPRSSRWRATTIPSYIEPYQGAATGVGGHPA